MLVWFYSGACRASFPLLLDMLLTCVFVVGCWGGEGPWGGAALLLFLSTHIPLSNIIIAVFMISSNHFQLTTRKEGMCPVNERAVEKNPKTFVYLFLCFWFSVACECVRACGSYSHVKITEACVRE